MLCSLRASPPLKRRDKFSDHPVGFDSRLQMALAFGTLFFFKFEHAGLDVTDRNGRLARFKFKKRCAKWTLLSAAGCHTVAPDQITQYCRIVCRGQEGPKGSKSTLRPDLQASTWPRPFFKKPTNRKKVVRKSSTIISRKFWVNNVWTLWGQDSPLINKKVCREGFIFLPCNN